MDHIKLEAVGAVFAVGERKIIDDVSLSVETGQWLSIVGANEAGKTTLLHLLSGWRAPSSGQILYNHVPIVPNDRVKIVFAPGPEDLPDHLWGSELIDIVKTERPRPTPADWTIILECLNADRWLERPIGELSLGTRRKVALACSLCASPDVLLLDEAFDALDAVSSVRIRGLLRERVAAKQMAIISASHAWESVFADSDTVCFLAKGRAVRTLARSEFQDLALQSEKIQATILSAFGQS